MKIHRTFRVVNEPFLLLGQFDWRYCVIACIPGAFAWGIFGSKVLGLLVTVICQYLAYEIYSEDANLPLIWLRTIGEKLHVSAFK